MGRLKKLAKGLLATLVGLLVLECGARVLWTLTQPSPPEAWFRASDEYAWERKPGFSGGVYGAKRSFDDRGYVTADSKQARSNERKIVFLGDSCSAGNGVKTEETFVEVLDGLLPEAAAINLAVPGYTSLQGVKRLEHLELDAKVVVFSFSFNDRRYMTHADETDSDEQYRRIVEAESMSGFGESIYLLRVLRAGLAKVGVIKRPPAGALSLDEAPARVGPERYRANLERAVAAAKKKGATLVFLLLKDSPVHLEHLGRGVELAERGDVDGAVTQLQIAVRLKNWFSDLARIHLAEIYRKQGKDEDAKRILTLASPWRSRHGGLPIHHDDEYRNIAREVAEQHGVTVVDAAPVLEKHPENYDDFTHFDARAHARIAELLRAPLAAALVAR